MLDMILVNVGAQLAGCKRRAAVRQEPWAVVGRCFVWDPDLSTGDVQRLADIPGVHGLGEPPDQYLARDASGA